MDALDLPQFGELLLRWVHVVAAIIWIGFLYFFNFVFLNFAPTVAKDQAKNVIPGLLGRVVRWAKWGAMVAFIAGLLMYLRVYFTFSGGFRPNGFLTSPEGGMTDRSIWIHSGMIGATIMWALMWFVAGPAYNKIIPAVAAGGPPPADAQKRAKAAGMTSTILTGPVILAMLGTNHYASVNVLIVVGPVLAVAITMFLVRVSAKVKPF